MIFAIGDSHAWFTFAGIPGVKFIPLGPVTMKRIGSGRVRTSPPPELGLFLGDRWGDVDVVYGPDTALVDAVQKIQPQPGDVLILSCGESDVRCFIKYQVENGADLDELLGGMVAAYIERAATLEVNGARVAISSITPPTTRERCSDLRFPAGGTDEERVVYTRKLNALLAAGCPPRGLLFIDTFDKYADENGMIRLELSDGGVHVKITDSTRDVLRDMGLIS